MATLITQGKYFAGVIKLDPKAPTFSRGNTVEIDEPFRKSRCYIIRVFREFSVLFGRWEKTDWDEELALQNAIGWQRRADLDAEVVGWPGRARDPDTAESFTWLDGVSLEDEDPETS